MNFGQAVSRCLKNYATFSGRASRSEFWWFFLLWCLIIIVPGFFDSESDFLFLFSLIVALGLLIPYWAVTCRRLHDTGRSGWWQLVFYIPVVGLFFFIFWCTEESGRSTNEYGDPVV